MSIKITTLFFSGLLFAGLNSCWGQTNVSAVLDSHQQAEGYRLVWADEFNKDGPPDTASWRFEEGFARNQELQWYQSENAYCKNGYLIIEGRRESKPNPGYITGSNDWKKNRDSSRYTASCINTAGKLAWKYGRFIMRGRINISEGLWPAWWTLALQENGPQTGR